eukprot:14712043-Heterocapsa_arctica.AAC.1
MVPRIGAGLAQKAGSNRATTCSAEEGSARLPLGSSIVMYLVYCHRPAVEPGGSRGKAPDSSPGTPVLGGGPRLLACGSRWSRR